MARRRSFRGLTPDDVAIWKRVERSVDEILSPGPVSDPDTPPPVQIDPGLIPPTSASYPLPVPARKKPAAPKISVQDSHQMDRKTYDRLRKGKMTPEARIDLHGLTAEMAQGALTRFILKAHSNGARMVLVITGKGRSGPDEEGPLPYRRGVLRYAVPDWLSRPPLGSKVLKVLSAHRSHGGAGAYYVYLRRHRT